MEDLAVHPAEWIAIGYLLWKLFKKKPTDIGLPF